MTHVFTSIFPGFLKNVVFRSVALISKVMGCFRLFYTDQPCNRYSVLCTLPNALKKSKKCQGDCVKNGSVGQKYLEGAACLGFNY